MHEEVEVDCLAGMEWDLHLLVADQMVRHTERLLTPDAKQFHDKNGLLQNTVSVRLKKWSNDIITSYDQVKEVRQSNTCADDD